MGPDAAEGVVAGWRLEIAAERDRLPAYARMPKVMDCPDTILWPAACTLTNRL